MPATVPLPVPSAATAVARALVDNVAGVVLGKRDRVELVVAGLLSGGHVLLEDVPGVGKTLLARSLARSVSGSVARVQGTADLMPSDITGVNVFDPGTRLGVPRRPGVQQRGPGRRGQPGHAPGPALLEAMAEGQVTVDGVGHRLPRPFFVIATQNPYGDAGTFPLAEGQSDRFSLIVSLGLPGRDAERAVLRGDGGLPALEGLSPVVDGPAVRRRWRPSTAPTPTRPWPTTCSTWWTPPAAIPTWTTAPARAPPGRCSRWPRPGPWWRGGTSWRPTT